MKTVNHVCAHLSTMCPVYTARKKKKPAVSGLFSKFAYDQAAANQ